MHVERAVESMAQNIYEDFRVHGLLYENNFPDARACDITFPPRVSRFPSRGASARETRQAPNEIVSIRCEEVAPAFIRENDAVPEVFLDLDHGLGPFPPL